MAEKEIKEKVGALSEALVLIERSDLKALADVYARFQEIGEWATEASMTEVATAAEAAGKLVKDVILEDAPDPAAALAALGQTVSAFQAIICDGRSAQKVVFPPELGLGRLEQSTDQGAAADSDASSDEGVRHPTALPPQVDEKIFADFLSRQGEVLQEVEGLILCLEKSDDSNKLGALRRIIHTLKGEAGMLGLEDVQRLCHTTEDVLENSRPNDITDWLLRVKDWLDHAFGAYSGKGPAPGPVEEILTPPTAREPQEEKISSSETSKGSNSDDEPAAQESVPPEEKETQDGANPFEGDAGLLEDFVTEAGEHLAAADLNLLTLETDPRNDEALNAVFRAFHTIKGVAGFLALDDIRRLAHQAENLLDRARKGELALEDSAIDVTFDAVDTLKRLVGALGGPRPTGEPSDGDNSVGELLGRINSVVSGEVVEQTPSVATEDRKLGEILVDSGTLDEESVESALQKQQEIRDKSRLGEQLVRDGKTPAKEVATL